MHKRVSPHGDKDRLGDSKTLIDSFKVGHHGSKTSTSIKLLEQIEPDIALISCGKDNKFNHPNQETLEVLSNIKTLRTDILGTIDIFFKRNGYMIK